MTTSLKHKAYWLPVLLVAMPTLLWVFLDKLDMLDYFRIGLVFFLCFLILIFSLSSNYKQYSIDNQNLTIKNLIIQKTVVISIQDIINHQISEKKAGKAIYHNIIIQTKQKTYTLNGVYVNGMIQLYENLEKFTKENTL